MTLLNLRKNFQERFSVKVFVIFTVFISITFSSFVFFFIQYQKKSLKDDLIKEGKLLARLLAYNSKLGVFSEEKDLLKDPVEAVLQQEKVLSVSIFSFEDKLLTKQKRQGRIFSSESEQKEVKEHKEMIKILKDYKTTFYLEYRDKFEFWAPVFSASSYSSEEALFFKEDSSPKNQIIGFAGIIIGKEILQRKFRPLLFKSIIGGIILLILSSLVIYFMANKVTKPLDSLTERVKNFEMRGSLEKVPVETKDELGRLALAFNHLSESLKKKEREKEQFEEQFRHVQKMEAIALLSGGIAHDFNNILTAVVCYGRLLKMNLEQDPLLSSYVKQILTAAGGGTKLIQGLLTFSRKQTINPQRVNLNEIIKNIKGLLPGLLGKEIEFRTGLADNALIVMVDSGQIEQVMMNLALNARDAMTGEGIFSISTESVELKEEFFRGRDQERPGHYALIVITDSGMGMDEETRKKIFDPFFTTKEVGKGSGLGLTTVYGVIKQHQGYIDVYSKPGKGTAFKLYFPLLEGRIEPQTP